MPIMHCFTHKYDFASVSNSPSIFKLFPSNSLVTIATGVSIHERDEKKSVPISALFI